MAGGPKIVKFHYRKDEFMDLLNEALWEAKDEELDTAWRTFDSVADKTLHDLKERSPKRAGGGDYAASWTLDKPEGSTKNRKGVLVYGVTIYNEDHYRLTHLLEKGHVTRNQYGGPYKRTPAHRHIKDADDYGKKLLIRELETKL